MSEDARGRKRICELNGVDDYRTAKKNIQHMERITGMRILFHENGGPVVSISVYRQARMVMATKK